MPALPIMPTPEIRSDLYIEDAGRCITDSGLRKRVILNDLCQTQWQIDGGLEEADLIWKILRPYLYGPGNWRKMDLRDHDE